MFFFCNNIAALILFHGYFSDHSLSFIFLIFYFDIETHVALRRTLSYVLLKRKTLGGVDEEACSGFWLAEIDILVACYATL